MSTEEIKEMYDRQAGEGTEFVKNNKEYHKKYCKALADIINRYNPQTVCEAGVGEATTLKGIQEYIYRYTWLFGFDISPERLKYAQKNLPYAIFDISDMLDIDYQDDCFDVVYTSHSIEPNQGKEKEILKELYRITKKYLILLEPIYEYASPEGKKRMEKLGYITNLLDAVENYKVVESHLFEHCINKLNPTGLIVICKKS